jgi:hypothetical protein
MRDAFSVGSVRNHRTIDGLAPADRVNRVGVED